MIPAGPYVVDRDQPALTRSDTEIVDRFHYLYYQRWVDQADTINLSWFGYRLLKCPLDLWMYQELLVRTRPDVVVETGTFQGGSALYLACIFDQIGNGDVITIDTVIQPNRPVHPRIQYILGSSIDPDVVSKVRAMVAGRRAMVILDSDHTEAHVHAEMSAYSPLVHLGDYMIVEDTNVNGHPAWPDFGPGPMEAVNRFLSARRDFEIDERCERFMMTLNPRGYLRRREPQSNV
ncbi:MAG TPA: CmcI family methyltransferase [Vicinamibacterales bacterium]|jgi:cephalosporin hydroxylase